MIFSLNWTQVTKGEKHYDKRMVSYRETVVLFTTAKKGVDFCVKLCQKDIIYMVLLSNNYRFTAQNHSFYFIWDGSKVRISQPFQTDDFLLIMNAPKVSLRETYGFLPTNCGFPYDKLWVCCRASRRVGEPLWRYGVSWGMKRRIKGYDTPYRWQWHAVGA